MAGTALSVPAPVLYLRSRFGGDFTETDGTVSAGTTLTKLVSNDPERVALTLVNLGTENVYVAPTNTVSTTSGIVLIGGGGLLSLSVRDDFLLPTRSWWAIAASGTNDIYYVSLTRYVSTGT